MQISANKTMDFKDPRYWVTSKWTKADLDDASIQVDLIGKPPIKATLRIRSREGKLFIAVDCDFATCEPTKRVAVQIFLTQPEVDSIAEHPDQSVAKFKLGKSLRFQ